MRSGHGRNTSGRIPEARAPPRRRVLCSSKLSTDTHSGHRTPWQILGDVATTGSRIDLVLWREFEMATHGLQAIRWSNGLRREVGLGKAQSGEELVAAVVGGEVIYVFTTLEWRAHCRTRGARGKVLRLAEEGGEVAVRRFMEELRAANPWIWPSAGAA